MKALVVLGFFVAFCLSAPLYKHEETVDKGDLRSYLILFNEHAPHIIVMDQLLDWIRVEAPYIDSDGIENGVWYIEGTSFRGFQAYLSNEGLDTLLNHRHIAYIEADTIFRTTQSTWSTRPDWGQYRINQKTRNVATLNPAGIYNVAASNISGYGGTNGWSWNTPFAANSLDGAGASIYIMDTGLYPNHQEYNGRVGLSRSFLTANTNPNDENGHGTHCAGSAAGTYRGIATRATLGNLRVLNAQGSGTTANIISAINFIANVSNQIGGTSRTQVLSMSLGGGFSQSLNDAINAAANGNIIPVVAAGNDGQPACNYSPASASGAITIGATDNVDSLTSFSNYGACVYALSPGYMIHSSWIGSTTSYNTISGTSMATPLAAGAIAAYSNSVGVIRTAASAKSYIDSYATKNVITIPTNKATAKNQLIYARWNN